MGIDAPVRRDERIGFFRRFASRLSFPYLFALFGGLFFLDLFIPDPIPFLDEAILGTLAVMLGLWRDKREQKEQKEQNR